MDEKCEHESSIVLKDADGVSVLRCTWACGRVLFQVNQKNGSVKTYTSDELAAELACLRAIEQAAREVVGSHGIYHSGPEITPYYKVYAEALDKLAAALSEKGE